MKAVNRTAYCKKCGSVNLKIKSSTGLAFYHCSECDSKVAEVEYEQYKTALSTCEKCKKDIFKAWITVDKEDESHEYWQAECINCNGTTKTVYVDKEGNLIDKVERELLIMMDKVEELKEEVENNESTISRLESENEELSYEIEKKGSKIYSLEMELDSSNREINRLEEEVSDLEWKINRYE